MEARCRIEIEYLPEEKKARSDAILSIIERIMSKYPDMKIKTLAIEAELGKLQVKEYDEVISS